MTPKHKRRHKESGKCGIIVKNTKTNLILRNCFEIDLQTLIALSNSQAFQRIFMLSVDLTPRKDVWADNGSREERCY